MGSAMNGNGTLRSLEEVVKERDSTQPRAVLLPCGTCVVIGDEEVALFGTVVFVSKIRNLLRSRTDLNCSSIACMQSIELID